MLAQKLFLYNASDKQVNISVYFRNGTFWSWGQEHIGKDKSCLSYTPCQIGSESDWEKIEIFPDVNFAIKTDGSLWSWGYNSDGILGHGDEKHFSEPTRIGEDNDWVDISVGGNHVLALKKSPISSVEKQKTSNDIIINQYSDGQINIDSKSQLKNIQVYNILGQLVYDESLNLFNHTLTTGNFQSGFYIIKVSTNNNFKCFKFVK